MDAFETASKRCVIRYQDQLWYDIALQLSGVIWQRLQLHQQNATASCVQVMHTTSVAAMQFTRETLHDNVLPVVRHRQLSERQRNCISRDTHAKPLLPDTGPLHAEAAADLSGKQVQVPSSLLQQLRVGVLAQVGQHLAVSALGVQADGAIWAAGDHTHAPPLTAELHHIQNVKGGLMAQHAQRDALHGATQELKAELAAALYQSNLIRGGSLHNKAILDKSNSGLQEC